MKMKRNGSSFFRVPVLCYSWLCYCYTLRMGGGGMPLVLCFVNTDFFSFLAVMSDTSAFYFYILILVPCG